VIFIVYDHVITGNCIEIWRRYGISSATYYKWKAKYGGSDASKVKRLKALEHENSRKLPRFRGAYDIFAQ
jgi:transposase